jgi:hypothetical protein
LPVEDFHALTMYHINSMTDYATAWNKWFSLIESGARDVSLSMLENADIAPGHHVLDVATGVGEPA